jgi:hypothetical protein
MPTRLETQTAQSKTFVRENQSVIDEVTQQCLSLAHDLIRNCGQVLPSDVLNRLGTELAQKDLGRFASMLRPTSTYFSAAGISSAFWDVYDAIGCVLDAVGVHWLYMTMEGRQWRINHCREHLANGLQTLAAVAPCKPVAVVEL